MRSSVSKNNDLSSQRVTLTFSARSTSPMLSSFAEFDRGNKKEAIQLLENIKLKYKAHSHELALRRACAFASTQEALNDIKCLIEMGKADINATSSDGRGPLELCVDYAISKIEKHQDDLDDLDVRTQLRMKLRVMSYLLTHEPPVGLLEKLLDKLYLFVEKTSDIPTIDIVNYNVVLLCMKNLLECAKVNVGLKEAFDAMPPHRAYQFKPILLCENHSDTATVSFAKTAFFQLKEMGYKLFLIELPGYRDTDACLTLVENRLSKFKEAAPDKKFERLEHSIEVLKLLKEQAWSTLSIDVSSTNESFVHYFQTACERQYGFVSELSAPLRDKGMFYHLAILAEKYQGAVVGLVGAAHGIPIMRHFEEWNASSSEWVPVVPNEILDLADPKMHPCVNQLIIQGAENLCMKAEGREAAVEKFLMQLQMPASPQNNALTKPRFK